MRSPLHAYFNAAVLVLPAVAAALATSGQPTTFMLFFSGIFSVLAAFGLCRASAAYGLTPPVVEPVILMITFSLATMHLPGPIYTKVINATYYLSSVIYVWNVALFRAGLQERMWKCSFHFGQSVFPTAVGRRRGYTWTRQKDRYFNA
ncbi:hypothetical protein B0H16DRAFT_1537600 [Mycena metata]|uniref:Uncharacterized protein n=1 Tax=Mycena metata TaxID=1033252 RepID=A0AAD7J4J0_9AGAR|nr:hypothetical protein B0H16DRAFT_1537600 [Mycena metata]